MHVFGTWEENRGPGENPCACWENIWNCTTLPFSTRPNLFIYFLYYILIYAALCWICLSAVAQSRFRKPKIFSMRVWTERENGNFSSTCAHSSTSISQEKCLFLYRTPVKVSCECMCQWMMGRRTGEGHQSVLSREHTSWWCLDMNVWVTLISLCLQSVFFPTIVSVLHWNFLLHAASIHRGTTTHLNYYLLSFCGIPLAK